MYPRIASTPAATSGLRQEADGTVQVGISDTRSRRSVTWCSWKYRKSAEA